MSVLSIKLSSFEKASHRTPIRRAFSAFAFANAAIFRRSLFPVKRFLQGARRSRGDFYPGFVATNYSLSVKSLTALPLVREPTGRWPIFYCRDRRERDFEVDMRIAISEARFESVSQGWRITLQGERDERRPVLWGSSRRGQIWNWLRFSASHHDFIFGEPLDPVGDHRWNFGLAVCGLFRAFSRMTPPTLKLSLIGKGSPARPARSIILLG
jgi:hypothetical protein